MDGAEVAGPVAAVVAAYLIGGIPFGLLIGKWAKGLDVREHGSKNIGATNVGRVCGWGWGLLVLGLDGMKGFGPVFWLTPALVARWGEAGSAGLAAPAAGLAAIVGHLAPPYLGFKGGKGVATSAGVFLALAPLTVAVAAAVFAGVVAIFRMVSLGSVLAALALPVAYLLRPPAGARPPDAVLALCVVAAVLVVVRHRENLRRIAAGTEPRLGGSKR